MDRNKLVKEFTAAVEDMRRTHGNGTYFWWLDKDDKGNNWAIVLGWSDGFDESETDDCADGTWRLCVMLAYQPWNSIMQCDYDVDWTMPYDEESGEVDDTEVSIYPDTDLADAIDWLLECYERYNIKLSEKIIDVVENNNFYIDKVQKQNNDYYVEINQYTPAGEDWWETIWFDGTDDGFIKAVRERYRDFDVYDEAEIWIDYRGKNGVPSSIRELIEDAEWKAIKLGELADGLDELELYKDNFKRRI